MKFPENIDQVGALQPDFMGFIFYPKSKRFVGESFSISSMEKLPKCIQKVAVFVNENSEKIIEIVDEYAFDYAQLHGNESVETCAIVKKNGIQIIKAFSVDKHFDFEEIVPYEKVCDYFLFDTKTDDYGGSGRTFDWQILKNYTLKKPFFLSGGLSIDNFREVQKLNHPTLAGLDFNSKLEDDTPIKNTEKVYDLINEIRTK